MSWVRGRDSHIITVRGIGRIFSYNISCHLFHLWRCCLWLQVDEETFISDDRFVSLKKAKESLWTLKVGWKTDWRIKWRNQINIPDKVRQIFQIFKYPNIPDKVRVGTGRRPIRMSGETMHCLYSSQHLQLFYPPPKRSISNWLIFCFFSCVPRKVILIVVSKILNVTQHVYIVLFSSSCDEIERCLQCQKLAGGLILW